MSEQTIKKASKMSLWKKIVISLIIVAILCGGFVFYLAQSAQKHVENFLKENGVTYGTLNVNWRRHFTAHDAKIKISKENSINVETIKGDVNFSGRTSKNIELEKVSYQFLKTDISIPSMTLQNYSLNNKNADANDVFVFDIKNVAVKKIVIPTMLVNQKIGNENQTETYNNIVYDDVDKGIIKKLTADSFSSEIRFSANSLYSTKQWTITTKAGKSVTDNFNFAFLMSYYNTQSPATDEQNPFKDVLSNWSIHDVTIDDLRNDKEPIHIKFDTLSGTKFSLRLLPFSLTDFINSEDRLALYQDTDKTPSTKMIAQSLDMLSSIGAADAKVDRLSFSTNDTIGEIKNGSLSYQDGHFNFAMNDFKVKKGDKVTAIDNFSISDLRFTNVLEILKKFNELEALETGNKSDTYKDFSNKVGLGLIPRFNKVHFSGVHIPADDDAQRHSSLDMDSADIDANFSLGAIPTSLKVALNGITVSAAEWDKQFSEKSIPDITQSQQKGGILEALGYTTIKADMLFDASWNEQSEVLDVNELSFKYADMGNTALKGSFSNVNPAFFSDNTMTIAAAALGIRAQNIDLSVNADDFLSRYEKYYDSITGEKFSDERKQAAIKTRLAVALFLGAENSQAFGDALQYFIQNGGTLNIHAKAKSKQGLGLLDLLQARLDPLSLLNKIDLSAETQH
ncbi:hypothetical protein [uncultured Bartonella sp.]|uniref:hypothetical protein n=1 Tax=uncultured Bartonella sp. TaxID=104108 RepID=UPI0025F0ADF3|nr:hypothetical protein [uncultured Bartonella sp.]